MFGDVGGRLVSWWLVRIKKLIKNKDRVSFLIDYIEGLEIKDEKKAAYIQVM